MGRNSHGFIFTPAKELSVNHTLQEFWQIWN